MKMYAYFKNRMKEMLKIICKFVLSDGKIKFAKYSWERKKENAKNYYTSAFTFSCNTPRGV